MSKIFKEAGLIRRSFRYVPVILSVGLLMAGCSKKGKQNLTDSQNYKKAVSDFYIGLAAEQTDNALFAYNKMFEVTKLYPDEPSVWANLGVFAMRQGNYDLAQKRLSTALKLAPKNGKIQYLMGLLKSQQGQIEEAAADMRTAVKLAPGNPYIHYALVQELERQNSQGSDKEISQLISDLKKMYPDNLAITLEEMRFAARQKDVK
ncbi:MAG TPA: tetratricopeptide repeat protein, partial [Balneolales bacterium]|nr:tetratricopeptide repeat protein [Balneolales bacterium]